MKIAQELRRAEDKKHSVIYKPVDNQTGPQLVSSVYLLKAALPTPAPERLTLTVEVA